MTAVLRPLLVCGDCRLVNEAGEGPCPDCGGACVPLSSGRRSAPAQPRPVYPPPVLPPSRGPYVVPNT